MITTYIRSSSFGTHTLCEHQYFLEYVLGLPKDTNKKAEMGTIFHKVMECLANARLLLDNNCDNKILIDKQLGIIGQIDKQTLHSNYLIDTIFNLSYKYYTQIDKTVNSFTSSDKTTIREWIHKTLHSYHCLFDPRRRHIIAAEPRFDLEIDEPWASYEFKNPLTGQMMLGKLRIKGTIDLVTQVAPLTYEVIDWKTGQRKDWGTGKPKNFFELCIDPQLRIYHYAISRMFPDIKQIIMTIIFVRDGGPYTMAYGPKDIKDTLEMLRRKFEDIKKCTRPKLKLNTSERWFCDRVCHYGRNCYSKNPSQTICQYIRDKILRYGMDEVVRTETHSTHLISNYNSPGE
jgi:hypothetical protein